MKTELLYRPTHTLAKVTLAPGEEIRAEGGSMVAMSAGVTLETKMEGGFLKSLARSVMGGESFFINKYRAPANGGEIYLAPELPGDMVTLDLSGQPYLVQSGSFVASDSGVELDTTWGGSKSFFGGTGGLTMLKTTGTGTMLLSSYGAIHDLILEPGQKYTVDTGHLVAFPDTMGFEVKAIGGFKATMFSGEGFIVELTGPGKVLMQSRSVTAFLNWLIPQLPQPSSNN
jgi:uncharacterized protein (TIGR00266 family)